MKLVVLGANGRTGRLVVAAALDRGFRVTGVVRSGEKEPGIRHERLTMVVGDPCDRTFLKQVLRHQDVVISTLGPRRPTKSATSIYYRSADALVDAAWETGLTRVLVTSTALLFREQTAIGHVLRFLFPNLVQSAARMENVLSASHLNWTTARPGFLKDNKNTLYRCRKGELPRGGTSVSRHALAAFLVDAIEDPNAECVAFGVSSERVLTGHASVPAPS